MSKRKSVKIKGVVVGAFLAVAVLLLLVAHSQSKKGSKGMGGRPRGQMGSTVFSVKTMEAQASVLHDYVSTNGEVEAQSSIEVFPDMAGKIKNVYVNLGSPVRKGSVIARVDPSDPGTQYALSPVYAPISGSIVSTPLKEGTTVSKNSAITIIGDVDSLQITANIPERYVALLKTGLSADISLEAYPGVVFKATISRVSPVVDAASRTKEIILNFDKKDSRINAGMFAKVILYTRDFTGAVIMPSDSVVTKDGKKYAYIVLDNSTVEQREIRLGESVDGMVQVLEGIKEGERIVTEGQTSLSDGVQVLDISQRLSLNNENKELGSIENEVKGERIADKASDNKAEKDGNPPNTKDSEKKGTEKKSSRSWGGVSSTGER